MVIGSQGSPDRNDYDVKVEYNVGVPMRDGVEISTNIYRPNAPGRFPVLLLRTPYSKIAEYCLVDAALARKGYVVVQNNVQSGKCKFCSAKIAGVWESQKEL